MGESRLRPWLRFEVFGRLKVTKRRTRDGRWEDQRKMVCIKVVFIYAEAMMRAAVIS